MNGSRFGGHLIGNSGGLFKLASLWYPSLSESLENWSMSIYLLCQRTTGRYRFSLNLEKSYVPAICRSELLVFIKSVQFCISNIWKYHLVFETVHKDMTFSIFSVMKGLYITIWLRLCNNVQHFLLPLLHYGN